MKLYRAMIADADGLPMIGRSARKLGVRTVDRAPNNDVVAVSPTDIVRPGKGMSVAPHDPINLAENRRPPQVNGGTGSDPVWELDVDDLGSDLNFNQDTATHGLIEPASPMAFAEYERALETTRAKWTRHIG